MSAAVRAKLIPCPYNNTAYCTFSSKLIKIHPNEIYAL